ncbi:MAG TPA: hypothetical protein VK929_08675 [Longimicrobiales bacterium]|nr:hypothetical protein [Longimicrobiales bacterium]
MQSKQYRALAPGLMAILVLSLTAGGCSDTQADGTSAGAPDSLAVAETADAAVHGDGDTSSHATASATVPAGPVTDLPPNELGEIMVLEYHRLGENEGEWVRRPENFRRDLETLYQRGYRPVLMRDVVRGHIDVPAGTTPVVFTIDDSSLGQFYLLEDGSIDPRSMMGMWESFRSANPGWYYGAVWCILPGAEHPSNFFGEKATREVPRAEREDRIRRKMEHIAGTRHEACNHTMWHARLDRYEDAFVQDQIGSGQDSIGAYLPDDYEIVTFALPLGMWPSNRSLAWQGTYRDGRTYRNLAVLEVTGGPNPSPFDTRFDPHSVKRLIVAPGALERQLDAYDSNPLRRYVSDGDTGTITIPAELQDRLDRSRLGGRQVRVREQ